MTGPELHFITVADASRRITRRELSPVELTEAYLQRIAAVDDQLQSFVMLTADLARRQAKAAEAEIMRGGPRGPLHGIPYCLKDIVETAGIRTTAQSKLLADHVPAKDSAVAAKLAAAGPRIEPPVSLPIVAGARPAATAAPEPEDEPAG